MEKEEKDIKILNEEEEIEKLQKEIKVKPKKDLKKKNGLGTKIFNIIFWVAIFVLFAVWITDFTMVKLEEDPIFCVSKTTYDYDDGDVKECIGLGYKVYQYNLSNKTATEFGPFFTKMSVD